MLIHHICLYQAICIFYLVIFKIIIKREIIKMAQYYEIQVNERLPLLKSLPLSLQHLFAMFGSTVLVPVIFGINPAIILLMNGVGTLFYIFITKGKIPAYLGSSFAFISPVTVVM